MKFSLFNPALLLLTTPLLTLAQNDGSCVTSCETTDPASSFCNGDETGAALDACQCQSFEAGTSLINCIKTCPAAQISAFAAGVPASCRDQLFPGVSVSSSGAAATSTSVGESSTASSPAASPTSSSGKTGTGTATTTTGGTTSTTAGSTASQSAKASGSAAVKGSVLDISMAAGLIGGVLAMLMS